MTNRGPARRCRPANPLASSGGHRVRQPFFYSPSAILEQKFAPRQSGPSGGVGPAFACSRSAHGNFLPQLTDLAQEVCFAPGESRARKGQFHLAANRLALAGNFQEEVTNGSHNGVDCLKTNGTFNVICPRKFCLFPGGCAPGALAAPPARRWSE